MIFGYHIDYDERVEIGKPIKQLNTLYDMEGNEVDVKEQPIIATRYATFEEYIKYIENNGGHVMQSSKLKDNGQYKFVEVSTD